MDSSPLRSKSNYHARSISLPSRLHPLIPHIDEHLNLDGLQNMFHRLDDLLLLSHTQQAFAQQQEETWVEEVLEKYLRQDVQNLLSIFRRRRDTNGFAGYLTSRKKAKKEIQKSLKELKSIKSKTIGIASDKSHGIFEILRLLNQVEAAVIGVFESLLSHIAGTKVESRVSGFSLVSKLVRRTSVASKEEETNTKAFENFDSLMLHCTHSTATRQARLMV